MCRVVSDSTHFSNVWPFEVIDAKMALIKFGCSVNSAMRITGKEMKKFRKTLFDIRVFESLPGIKHYYIVYLAHIKGYSVGVVASPKWPIEWRDRYCCQMQWFNKIMGKMTRKAIWLQQTNWMRLVEETKETYQKWAMYGIMGTIWCWIELCMRKQFFKCRLWFNKIHSCHLLG